MPKESGPSASSHDRTNTVATALWVFLFTSLLYLSTAKGVLEYGDDLLMLQVTQAIVERGDIDIPATTPGAIPSTDGQHYSKHGIVPSVLAIPFYVVGRLFERVAPEAAIVDGGGFVRAGPVVYAVSMVGTFSTSGAVALLYLTCRALGFGQLGSVVAALSLGVGTFAWHYARTFMTEPTSMLSILLTFYGILRFERGGGRIWLVVSGLAASLALLSHPRNAVAVAATGLWVLWNIWPRQRHHVGGAIQNGILWVGPILVGCAMIAVYNVGRFGTVQETGFGGKEFEFSTPIYVGLAGLVLSPGKGLFAYAPILSAGIIGWFHFRNKHPVVAIAVAIIVGAHLLFHATYYAWYGGGVWGPRYLVVILPLLAIGVAALIREGVGRRGWMAFAALGGLSIFIQLASVLVPYVPYEEAMQDDALHDRLVWRPQDSPVLVHASALVRGEYPLDVAPHYYASPRLAFVQLAALVAAVVVLAMGLRAMLKVASPSCLDGQPRGLARGAARFGSAPRVGYVAAALCFAGTAPIWWHLAMVPCVASPAEIGDADAQSDPTPAVGTFVRAMSSQTIYIVQGSVRRKFGDWNTYRHYGGAADLSNVHLLSDAELDAIPEGSPIPSITHSW